VFAGRRQARYGTGTLLSAASASPALAIAEVPGLCEWLARSAAGCCAAFLGCVTGRCDGGRRVLAVASRRWVSQGWFARRQAKISRAKRARFVGDRSCSVVLSAGGSRGRYLACGQRHCRGLGLGPGCVQADRPLPGSLRRLGRRLRLAAEERPGRLRSFAELAGSISRRDGKGGAWIACGDILTEPPGALVVFLGVGCLRLRRILLRVAHTRLQWPCARLRAGLKRRLSCRSGGESEARFRGIAC
jgi:hypothetical protein